MKLIQLVGMFVLVGCGAVVGFIAGVVLNLGILLSLERMSAAAWGAVGEAIWTIVGIGIILATTVGGVVAALLLTKHRGNSYPECQKCRYNLTGNVSGVCPECGTAIANSKAKSQYTERAAQPLLNMVPGAQRRSRTRGMFTFAWVARPLAPQGANDRSPRLQSWVHDVMYSPLPSTRRGWRRVEGRGLLSWCAGFPGLRPGLLLSRPYGADRLCTSRYPTITLPVTVYRPPAIPSTDAVGIIQQTNLGTWKFDCRVVSGRAGMSGIIRRTAIVGSSLLFVLSMAAIPLSRRPRYESASIRSLGLESTDSTFDGWFGIGLPPPWGGTGLRARIGIGKWRRVFVGIQADEFKIALASSVSPNPNPTGWRTFTLGPLARIDIGTSQAFTECFGPSGRNAEQLRLQNADLYCAAIPLWLMAFFFGIIPSMWFIRGRLRRLLRRPHGVCAECAYDLTGNLSGVCPECGTKINRP